MRKPHPVDHGATAGDEHRPVWLGAKQNGSGHAAGAPVYQPEVAAEAIYSVIQRPVNELWVGKSTIQSILGGLLPSPARSADGEKAWEGQFTGQPKSSDQQDDLFTPVRGNHPGHGPFNDGARRKAVTISADLPGKVAAGVGVAVATMALRALFRRSGKRR